MTAPDKRPLSFLDGIGVGLCAVALLPLVTMLINGGAFSAMYRDFGDAHVPRMTAIVLHPAWRIGVPLVVMTLAAGALVVRPHRYAMIAVAVLAVIAAAVSYVGAYLPIFELSGKITAG